MAKKAVLIGCNYPGTQGELRGCVNDVLRMYVCLVERYGFAEQDIAVLIDTDESYTQPTGRNICAALVDLVCSAAPGDSLFVHYSGHGVRLPSENPDDETGYDECIVPTDINLITDDDFRALVDKVPKGCRITIVSDSCHSGGLISAAKEQIGESTKKSSKQKSFNNESISGVRNFVRKSVEGAIESRGIHISSKLHHSSQHQKQQQQPHHQQTKDGHHIKDKSLPLHILMEILQQKTGKNDITADKLRPTLFSIFGEDSTPKIKSFMKKIFSKLQEHENLVVGGVVLGVVGGLALHYIDHKHKKKHNSASVLSDNGILISGCQTDETSADVTPSGDAGLAYGALSDAVQRIIEETDGKVSNQKLVIKARELLTKQGFSQHPGLYCSDDHVDDPFVC
ncbi:hypothetical protein ACP275_08G163800 [Erythranthe tilingii]